LINFTQLPNERRNFVHKRLFGAAKGFVTSGFNPVSAVAGLLAPVRPTPPRSTTARPTARGAAGQELGRVVKFAGPRSIGTTGTSQALALTRGSGPCPGLLSVRDPITGNCVNLDALLPGGAPAITPAFGGAGAPGEVVMGRYGAAEVPGNRVIQRAVCRPGMIVGDDGLCYNKSQITNKQREWPKGRRPLLTGGDMAAISKAARAGARLERTTKRLQKIGLMKKAAPRRIKSGPTEHHHH